MGLHMGLIFSILGAIIAGIAVIDREEILDYLLELQGIGVMSVS